MKIHHEMFEFHGVLFDYGKLDALYVVYPGLHRFKLADGIEAVPLWAMLPA